MKPNGKLVDKNDTGEEEIQGSTWRKHGVNHTMVYRDFCSHHATSVTYWYNLYFTYYIAHEYFAYLKMKTYSVKSSRQHGYIDFSGRDDHRDKKGRKKRSSN